MSKIQAVFRLERRPGILAGAIASLRRSGLQFISQRLTEEAEGPLLVLEAEGDLVEVGDFSETMRATPGVREITDLTVDGISVMEVQSVEEAEALAPEPAEAVEPDVPPVPEPAVATTPAPPPDDPPTVSDAPESQPPRETEPGEETGITARRRRRLLRLRTRL